MHKVFVALVVALTMTSCSDKPTVYQAKRTINGRDLGVIVTLTLNNFSDSEERSGDGTLELTKTPGSTWIGKEATYPATWKWIDGRHSLIISVQSANDAFMLGPNMTALGRPTLDTAKSFWCDTCEPPHRHQLGYLPGVFVRND